MNIQQLLEVVIERQASDLHLIVGYPPMIRVFGDLIPVLGMTTLTSEEMNSLIFPILTPTQKSIFENNFELDFGFSFKAKDRFRVNIYRQQGTIAVSLRFIPYTIPTLRSLGLPPVIEKLLDLKQGLILVTGPTGHGKSTTLASFINQINARRQDHIITIEDPVEYVYPKGKAIISQREMYYDTKSWANSLKSALREDPDVVLIGELRDLETISSAITIAETGHLVFGTLHTNSASQTIDRIIDVFPQNQQSQIRIQLGATLEAVIAQRLLPTITPGRILALEILFRTPALAELIRSGKSYLIDNLIQTSGEMGMVSLESSLAGLYKDGKISLETAQNYAIRPELLVKMIGI